VIEKGRVSVIIPSRGERFLQATIDDVLAKAAGDVEVIPALDNYTPNPPLRSHPRVRPVSIDGDPHHSGMRQAINAGVAASSGEFVMKLDGHCMMAEGWDEQLQRDYQPDSILVPRRYSLDPETWTVRDHRPFVDYEYVSFPYVSAFLSVKTGNKWWDRQAANADILVDENMAFQGSAMFMARSHFERLGPLQVEGYGGFILDSEEMSNKTWLSGGVVLVTKRTWYAHLHKGKQYGRGYFINKWELRRGRKYHIDYWMHDRWPVATRKMSWLVDHFWPIPGWPDDWQNPKYEQQYLVAIGNDPQQPDAGETGHL
jgi:glycosyltransferase involved in cell wall biosynthesis